MRSLKLSGDFAELKRWEKQVSKAPKVLDMLSTQLAEETIDLIREGFTTTTDPYGKAWAKPKLRSGQALSLTGGLRSSWHRVSSNAEGFVVASGKGYAKYHQSGTGIYGPRRRRIEPIRAKALGPLPNGKFYRSVRGSPRRRMTPTGSPLPAPWKRRYVEAAHEFLTEFFS